MDQIQLAAKAIAREQKLVSFIRAVRNGAFGSDSSASRTVVARHMAAETTMTRSISGRQKYIKMIFGAEMPFAPKVDA